MKMKESNNERSTPVRRWIWWWQSAIDTTNVQQPVFGLHVPSPKFPIHFVHRIYCNCTVTRSSDECNSLGRFVGFFSNLCEFLMHFHRLRLQVWLVLPLCECVRVPIALGIRCIAFKHEPRLVIIINITILCVNKNRSVSPQNSFSQRWPVSEWPVINMTW